jgi:hypothetical protein
MTEACEETALVSTPLHILPKTATKKPEAVDGNIRDVLRDLDEAVARGDADKTTTSGLPREPPTPDTSPNPAAGSSEVVVESAVAENAVMEHGAVEHEAVEQGVIKPEALNRAPPNLPEGVPMPPCSPSWRFSSFKTLRFLTLVFLVLVATSTHRFGSIVVNRLVPAGLPLFFELLVRGMLATALIACALFLVGT